MSIFTKLKTATDFSASVIKEGFALIWPEKKSDGSIALQVKLEDGSVQEIGGGGTVDESRLLPENPGDGDVPVFNAAAATGGAWENQNLNEQIDSKISAHNTSLNAHPMQGATTNDYNGLDTNGSWYLSYGNNTSNVNAPANGPFFVMTKKWTNSSETAGAGMQIAIRNMTGSLVNQSVYVRTWSMSSGWRTWQKVGSSAMVGIPNYSAGVNITNAITQAAGSYTCPSAGWILINNLAPAINIYINGENLSPIGAGAMVPVGANDVVTITGYMQSYSINVLFYPNR